jgi:integrase
MTVNPCKGIQTEESGEKEPPRVLTIKEIKELIDLALTEVKEPIRVGKGKSGKGKMSIITVHPGDLIPWLTIGLFAGVRPDETLRLDWQDIDFERCQIDLPAKKAKGRTRRIIPMEPNLIAWLKPYRPESGLRTRSITARTFSAGCLNVEAFRSRLRAATGRDLS